MAQREAKELRVQWLEGAVRTKAAEDDEKAQQEILRMIRHMHIVAMHQKLTRIIKGPHTGLDYVKVPTGQWYFAKDINELYHYDDGLFECHVAIEDKPNAFYTHSSLKVPPSKLTEILVEHNDNSIDILPGVIGPITWRKVTEKAEMEDILLLRNKKHLQQVAMEEAPPSQPDLRMQFDDYGCGPNSDKILAGELTPETESFPTVVKTWLQSLKQTEKEKKCHPIDGWITATEFRQAFYLVKENTSSSPSGLNYTLWKCIASDDELCETMATMMSLPFVYGFVNDRWTNSIDVMLEKKRGLRQIHRLRIIGLVEADFNTALKIFMAKKLVQNAEKTDLTEEQWARPNRTAMDPALRKLLGFEYSRVMYVTLVFFANDATACFDRMVPDISTVITRKYGVEKNVMLCRNKVLEQLKRGVRTLHGDSEKTYQREFYELPMNGEYQGKADAASIWSIESHTFLRTHQQLTTGAFMPHVIDQTLAIRKNNDAYVDDDDMTKTKRGSKFNECERTAVKEAEHNAQLWNDIIFLSGAATAHHKSIWQGIAFDPTTCPPTIKTHLDGEIFLKDRKGVRTKIAQKASNYPNKGLGCHLAPTAAQQGTDEHEFETRRTQAQKMASAFLPIPLAPHEAHNVMQGRTMTSIGYSAAVTQFDEDQCGKLNTILNKVLLPKLRVNRHMPHAVVYSPLSFGGISWPSFQIRQDTESILTMIKHLRWNQTVGTDMLVVLSAWQLASGLCEPIMEQVDLNLSFIGVGWFPQVRKRLQAMKGRIWIERQWTPELQRQNDTSIMRSFILIPGITENTLKLLNYVRLYLRVITLADIANEQGNMIPGQRFSGSWQAKSIITWPEIPCPPIKLLNLFRRFCQRTFGRTSDGKRRYNAITLKTKMGTWYKTKRHTIYHSYISATHLYQRDGTTYKAYQHLHNKVYEYSYTTTKIVEEHIPVSAGYRDNEAWTSSNFQIEHKLHHTHKPNEWRAPSTKRPLAGSDGSVDIISGANASAYQVFTGNEVITGTQRTPNSEYITSYRSELHGEYLATRCIRENDCPAMTQVCDNERAVTAISKPIYNPTRMLDPEMDLILAINHERKQTPNPSKPEWVKGHTDDTKETHDMNDKERLNIVVDQVSGDERRHGTVIQETPYPGSGAMLIIEGKWVTTEYKQQIQTAIMKPKHRAYFAEKFKHIDLTVYDDILWKTIGLARRNLSHELNSRISKFMYNWLHTGHQKELFGHDGTCPCCGKTDETQLHMFQCPNPDMIRARKLGLSSLHQHLREKHIPPDVSGCLVELCTSLFDQREPSLDKSIPIMRTVIEKQQSIGIELLSRGFLSTSWIQAIQFFTNDKVEQKAKVMILGLWHHVMGPIWECRNNILHKTDNIVTRNAHTQLDSELQDWKILANERLHHTQQHLTNYSASDMTRWTIQHKKNTLHILQLAHRNYKQYMKDNSTFQTLISQYFERPA